MINQERYQKLSARFSNVPSEKFYKLHLSLAVAAHVKKQNEELKVWKDVQLTNNKLNDGTFAIRKGDVFVINDALVKKSIKDAKNKGVYRTFQYMFDDVVLDLLEDKLVNDRK